VARFIAAIPKIVVAILLTAAIINLLIGVFLRYVMIPVTDWLDMDSIPFTWVEEVGEMLLAWLTLVGAAIGVRERTHFTLHVLRFAPRSQAIIDRVHYALVMVMGAVASWFGVRLCLLNHTLVTPGLSIPLSVLYASCAVGGALLVVAGIAVAQFPLRRAARMR